MANIWPTTKADGQVVPDEEWNGIVDLGLRKGSATAMNSGGIIFSKGTNLIGEDVANFIWKNGTKRLGLGTNAPATILHLGATDNAFTIDESTNTPANPTTGSQLGIYVRNDKLIFVFDNAGTVRYFSIDLTATASQQVAHSLTAP